MDIRTTFYPNNAHYGINLHFSGEEVCQPNHGLGPAKRSDYLLHYILSGTGTYEVGHKAYNIAAGQGFIIFPGDTTKYEASSSDPWHYCWVGFNGDDCHNLLLDVGLSANNHLCNANSHEETSSLIQTIVNHSSQDLANPIKRMALLTTLFSGLIPVNQLPNKIITDPVKHALAFIHDNYQYDIRIQQIADTVNIERSWLYRLFVDEIGKSPKAYLTDYRLEMAQSYLTTTSLTLTEIALTCGFIGASSFHKQFKKAFEITPKAFRQIH